MKKIVILLSLTIGVFSLNAQTYKVIARSNDSILLYPSAVGAAIKSVIPGGSTAVANYRMIEKTDGGNKSILFVEFVNVVDKFLVTYETDMVTPGQFSTKIHSLVDVFKTLKRENAIYLTGEYLGMKAEVFQRPLNFKDVFVIDGINLQLPIKIVEIDAVAQLEKQKEEARIKRAESLKIDLEVLDDASNNKCAYYIAYLLKSGKFNAIYANEVKMTYDQSYINEIAKKYSEEQLNFIVRDVEAKSDCSRYAQ